MAMLVAPEPGPEPEPEPELPASLLALRWDAVSVQSARKKDLLRWLSARATPQFLAARRLSGELAAVAKGRSAAELREAYAAAVAPGGAHLLRRPRLLYHYLPDRKDRTAAAAAESGAADDASGGAAGADGGGEQVLWAELAAAGWERTALAAGAALLLGEDSDGGMLSPALEGNIHRVDPKFAS
jgi:hypothetical protein